MNLLNDHTLERSSVVANCRMNRERTLTGSNGYSKEIGFHPLDLLREVVATERRAGWLDLCCGTGGALAEAADVIQQEGLSDQIQIVGVDLVGGGTFPGSTSPCLNLIEASLVTWEADRQFDLITCVHGLHYIGDKLGLLARSASWLTESGRFTANLDLENVQVQNHSRSARIVGRELRRSGIEYDSRKKLVSYVGRKAICLPFRYLGADDQAGPNYTGQAAVNSYYERAGRQEQLRTTRAALLESCVNDIAI